MNKNIIYNGISIISCLTIVTTLSIYNENYYNISTLFNNMCHPSYKLIYSIIGANVATIGNELCKK